MEGGGRRLLAGLRSSPGSVSIGLLAVGLLAWAVIELVFAGTGAFVHRTDAAPAAELASERAREAIAFHELMPDATDDLGRLVHVNGTVLVVKRDAGFWVRDLRDHVVFVTSGTAAAPPLPQPDDAVRVRGVVSLFSLEARSQRLAAVEPVLPDDALVVRGVKIVPLRDGVELAGG